MALVLAVNIENAIFYFERQKHPPSLSILTKLATNVVYWFINNIFFFGRDIFTRKNMAVVLAINFGNAIFNFERQKLPPSLSILTKLATNVVC